MSIGRVVKVELDIDKAIVNSTPPRVTIRMGDVGTTTIVAHVKDGSDDLELEGCTAELEVQKPDGTFYVQSCEVLPATSELGVTLGAQAAASAGEAKLAYFRIRTGDEAISTQRFDLRVLPEVDTSGIESSDYISLIYELMAQVAEAVEEAGEAAREATAKAAEAEAAAARAGAVAWYEWDDDGAAKMLTLVTKEP